MSVLKIHVTYQCTAECDHCRFFCTTNKSNVIEYENTMKLISKLREINKLNLVVLMGGEPFLYADLIYKFVKGINSIGIKVRIETNAFWALSEQKALTTLKPLSNLNLHIILYIREILVF